MKYPVGTLIAEYVDFDVYAEKNIVDIGVVTKIRTGPRPYFISFNDNTKDLWVDAAYVYNHHELLQHLLREINEISSGNINCR